MQMIEVKLMDLKIDPANVRQTDRAPDEGLLSSIRAKGVIQPLVVRKNGNGYYVTDGGKRLSALHLLAADGDMPKDVKVPCVVREATDDATAADVSLTTNFIREDMHPVDIYEAFAVLLKTKPVESIAKEYGMPLPTVRQHLALGCLSPKVREAWKNGGFRGKDTDAGDHDDHSDEIAQFFTLLKTHEEQDAMFDRLKKQKKLTTGWQVKDAIVGGNNEQDKLIKFVGVDAYKAAGGELVEDLFGDNHKIMNPDVLKKAAKDKLLAECTKAVETDGYAWAEPLDQLPSGCQHSWQRAYNEPAKTQRSHWGMALYVDHSGKLDGYRLQKPEQRKAAEKANKTKAVKKENVEPKEFQISAALCGRLSAQITTAAEPVLAIDDVLGLAAIAAALNCSEGPICITRDGVGGDDGYHDREFAKEFERYRKMKMPQLVRILAGFASAALRMGGSVHHQLPLAEEGDADRVLLNALDPKKLNAQLRASFDAADYFAGMKKDHCLEAIKACDPKNPATDSMKKGALADLATELVKKSNAGGKAGYLPLEMRTSNYDGPKSPKAVTAKKAPAKKTKAKKAAKKRAA